jgi:hypothetical protein
MPRLFATLIGINDYPQNALMGCTQDVLAIDSMLQSLVDNPNSPFNDYLPAYFISPLPEEDYLFDLPQYARGKSIRTQMQPASFEMISDEAFHHFDDSKKGDTCLFFYSGHGSYAPAPAEIAHLDTLAQVETLVLRDSRSPGGRDLVDKELAYLFWKTFAEKPGINLIKIMDCCHAATNTRMAMHDFPLKEKALAGASQKIPFQKMLGHDSAFYYTKSGHLATRTIPFIQLSSSQKNEKSIDTHLGGVFTQTLVRLINTMGPGLSYRSLINLCNRNIIDRGLQQHPNVYATEEQGADNSFLQTDALQAKAFPIVFDGSSNQWRLQAGQIHGLMLSKSRKPLIEIKGLGRITTLTKVADSWSVLDPQDCKPMDRTLMYEGIPLQSGGKVPLFCLSLALKKEKEKQRTVLMAYKQMKYPPFEFTMSKITADYTLTIDPDKKYYCTRTNKNTPLFTPVAPPNILMDYMGAIGHWHKYLNLSHSSGLLTAKEFIFTCKYAIISANADEGVPQQKTIAAGETNLFKLNAGEKLIWSLNIQLKTDAVLSQCYVTCIYFSQNFEVNTHLVPLDASVLTRGQTLLIPEQGAMMALHHRDRNEMDVPPVLVKLILSDFPVDLSLLEHKGISLSQQAVRSTAKDKQNEWTVFDFFFDYN